LLKILLGRAGALGVIRGFVRRDRGGVAGGSTVSPRALPEGTGGKAEVGGGEGASKERGRD